MFFTIAAAFAEMECKPWISAHKGSTITQESGEGSLLQFDAFWF
jgi:hypothetical protein